MVMHVFHVCAKSQKHFFKRFSPEDLKGEAAVSFTFLARLYKCTG